MHRSCPNGKIEYPAQFATLEGEDPSHVRGLVIQARENESGDIS